MFKILFLEICQVLTILDYGKVIADIGTWCDDAQISGVIIHRSSLVNCARSLSRRQSPPSVC